MVDNLSDSEWQPQEIIDTYLDNQKKTIAELYSQIGILQTRIKVLEKDLENERHQREEMPVPKSFIEKTQELIRKNEKIQSDLDYYLRYVPAQIIINRKQKYQPTRNGGLAKTKTHGQTVEKNSLDKNKKGSTRGGGIPK